MGAGQQIKRRKKMKYLIASDIHGSARYCRLLMEAYEKEKADRMILLGDLLYHGARNDLTMEYSPKKVVEMLNGHKDEILCVRGNCDSEVDQMVLDFDIMSDHLILVDGKTTVFVTHGHIYNEDRLPKLHRGDVLLHGHTHVQQWEDHGDYYIFNPGSVSLPKNDSFFGYMTLENNVFTWKTLDGAYIKEIDVGKD